MLARRLLLLAAALMLLAVLAAGLAPQRPAGDGAPAPRPNLPSGTEVVEEISADADAGSEAIVEAQRGDVLKLEVSGDRRDSVMIERLDRIDAIEPSTPARFELLVDFAPGVYPIRLLEADRRIGTIQISG